MSRGTSESWTLDTGEESAGSSWIMGILLKYGGGGSTGIGRLIPDGKLGASGPETSIGTGCPGHGDVTLVLELASPYTVRSTLPKSLEELNKVKNIISTFRKKSNGSFAYSSRCEFCHAFFAIGLKTRLDLSSLETKLNGLSGRRPSFADEHASGSLAFFRSSVRNYQKLVNRRLM